MEDAFCEPFDFYTNGEPLYRVRVCRAGLGCSSDPLQIVLDDDHMGPINLETKASVDKFVDILMRAREYLPT